ncbi:hypothetical protein Ciccas_011098 [Cichlidogyrus casuarinus]|uniref:Impact N-terminal domain-containing protein n=1 Tax=Cichlidogyrus casuarinus TaxID=1844966 RepID=A0ABD2PTW1_9PLAT
MSTDLDDEIFALEAIYGDQINHQSALKSTIDAHLLKFDNSQILFQIVESVKEELRIITTDETNETSTAPKEESNDLEECTVNKGVPTVKFHLQHFPNRLKFAKASQIGEIVHGPIIEQKKSVFQGHCMICSTDNEVSAFITEMLAYKRVIEATHNILAWHFSPPAGSFISGCDDDGEHKAGENLLHFLVISGATNVVVMVTRFFGGIKLGPDRFKIINQAAKLVLSQAHLIPQKKQSCT